MVQTNGDIVCKAIEEIEDTLRSNARSGDTDEVHCAKLALVGNMAIASHLERIEATLRQGLVEIISKLGDIADATREGNSK